MTITIGDIDISKYITSCTVSAAYRGESTIYTLDGTARTDRIGGIKLKFALSLGLMSMTNWQAIYDRVQSTSYELNRDGNVYTVHTVGDIPSAYVYTDPVYGDVVTVSGLEVEEI